MEKEHKQWKYHLASPPFLIMVGILGTFLSYVLVTTFNSFIYYIFSYIREFMTGVKSGLINLYTIPSFPFHQLLRLSSLFEPKFIHPFQLILWGGLLVFALFHVGRLIYKLHISMRNMNKGTKGTESFATLEELEAQCRKVKKDDKEYEGISGVPVASYGDYIFIDDSNINTQTLGSPGSGKTESFTFPLLDIIMRAKVKDSVIILDVKGILSRKTKAEFEKYGYITSALNLVLPKLSAHYNPLELIREAYFAGDMGKAQSLASSLSYSYFYNAKATDEYWQNNSMILFESLILAVCHIAKEANKPQYVTIYTALKMLSDLRSPVDEKGYTPLDNYFDSLPDDVPAKETYSQFLGMPSQTRIGITSSMEQKLKNYLNEDIALMTADTSINIADIAFGDKPVALFLIVPDYDDSNYAVISTFLTQVNYIFGERTILSDSGELPRRVRLIGEEIMNIPPIPSLHRAMNMDREKGFLYHIINQSNAQLDNVYHDTAGDIKGACGNTYYLMSDDFADAEEFSKRLGDRTIVAPDRHGDPLSLDKSYGEREEGQALLNANELRNIFQGEWVVDRTKARKDLEGNNVIPKPVFANYEDGTFMQYAYQYLGHRFKVTQRLDELRFNVPISNITLQDIHIAFERVEISTQQPSTIDYDTSQYEQNEDVYENYLVEEPIEQRKEPTMTQPKEMLVTNGNPILEVLSKDQQTMLFSVAEATLSEMEYQFFLTLDTIEQVLSFANEPGREAFANRLKWLKDFNNGQ